MLGYSLIVTGEQRDVPPHLHQGHEVDGSNFVAARQSSGCRSTGWASCEWQGALWSEVGCGG